MALSKEVRRLDRKWTSGTGWPKRLDWLEIDGLRGWHGERIEFPFPMVAIVGENGSGKSTIIQAAASVYREDEVAKGRFASSFFPSTAWDTVENARINFGYTQGGAHGSSSVRKPTKRWLGNRLRPVRHVEYIDLSRIQPVSVRTGYAKIAKSKHTEGSSIAFEQRRVERLSGILGNRYESARFAFADVDENREIPVLVRNDQTYSGFHQGAGETTVAELLKADLPKTGLILIDEIESSLHPRAQRRLMRDLAEHAKDRELQIIITTHSPYVLEELPEAARIQIMLDSGSRRIVPGVSPRFSMTKMDDEDYPDCEIYVEDESAKEIVEQILYTKAPGTFERSSVVSFGAASVGRALGQMITGKRFNRPTCVFLDGDNSASPGCHLLPGGDAPEHVVFEDLDKIGWGDVAAKISRDYSLVSDALSRSMSLKNHHDWVQDAASRLKIGSVILWHAMCFEWASKCLPDEDAKLVVDVVDDAMEGLS